MADITANFELGTNGNDVLTSDSGSATAWDTRSVSGSTTIKYDTAHVAFGSLAAKFTVVAGGLGFLQWRAAFGTQTDHFGRFYFYATANPSSVQPIWQAARGADITRVARIDVNADGTLRILDQPATGLQSGVVPITLNQLIRIEYHVIHSATVGQIECKLFNTADSSTPSETITSPATWDTNTDADRIQFGYVSAEANFTYWMDNIIGNATSYPGPVAGNLAWIKA